MTHRSEQISLHLNAYLTAHSTPPDAILRELATETAERYPNETGLQVAPETGTCLTLLTRLTRARSGIEVGTFTGYSSICIARGLVAGGKLLCCDVSDEWTSVARKHWDKAGLTDRIELRLRPALDTLRALPDEEAYDVAFIDADKISYVKYWTELVPRVRSGGVIMVDNTFSHGRVLDAGNDNPSVIAVRAMNDLAAADDRVELIMLPIGDGLTVALKH
jgi:predicted O-methyltransferase YrrM